CVICEEERQYVPPRGQTWTTLQALQQTHTNTFREYEKGIIGIGSTPAFAIGQRALLVRTRLKPSAESMPLPSRTHISTRRWWNGRMNFWRAFTCTLGTSNGSCATIPLSSYGTAGRKGFGRASP